MDIQRIKSLLNKREEVDRELVALITGGEKKAVVCSNCKEEGHTARTCPKKDAVPVQPPPAPKPPPPPSSGIPGFPPRKV